MFSKKCKAHLDDVNMTRWEHFKFAFGFIVELKKAELALLLHMFAPRYCETYASDKIKSLAAKINEQHKD
jgi:hypothetical protein|tara:strand:+ start:1042 stop:1251 length:210 start_codon:yes stop_codon:yes gene_type:complete